MEKENKILNVKNVINCILVIVWMVTVFYFSGQTGDVSGETSGNLIRRFITFFNSNMEYQKLESSVETMQPYVRKLAHFTIYAIGGFLLYNLNKNNIKSKKKAIIISLIFGIIYSISDEIHQLFVDNRSGQVSDVIIDSLGVIAGIYLYILFKKLVYNNVIKNID